MSTSMRAVVRLCAGVGGLLLMLVAAQAISNRHNYRIDLTLQKKFSLSPRSTKVVSELTTDVQALAFIHSDRPENFFIEDLLRRMQSLSPHFYYRVVDMNRSPALARQYNASQYGTIVFEANGQREGAVIAAGETDVIATLLKLTRGTARMIYFLTGHGEGDIDDATPNDGHSKIASALTNEHYRVRKLSLGVHETVPDDADVVVMLGPKGDLLPHERAALSQYLERGGALLVLLDPPAPSSLTAFLENYGFRFPPMIAVDPDQRLYAGETLTFRASPTRRPHPMIYSVNSPPIFSLAQVIGLRGDRDKGIITKPILVTSEGGWGSGVTDLTSEELEVFVEGRDRRGPVAIAGEAAVQHGDALGRIVVFGDSDLSNNALIEQGGNKDLLVNAVNWLADDIGQMAARPAMQKPGINQFFMSAIQGNTIWLITVVAMPGAFFLAGLGIFAWRRQRA